MPARSPVVVALRLVAAALFAGCGPAAADAPTAVHTAAPAASRAADRVSPPERAVLAAMDAYKRAIVASDTVALERIWSDGYTFINAQGGLVTREQRLANFRSGATDVALIDAEREVTVRVYGDMAVVQNLSTLRGQFSGRLTDTDLRGTFVWLHRGGRWQLVTNQLTPVVP